MDLTEGDIKRKYVKHIFDFIAKRYDFLNHLLSFGFDIYWRKFAIEKLNLTGKERVIDVACGTGDFSITAWKKIPVKIVGVDVSLNMLRIFSDKAKKERIKDLYLLCAEAENLPFKGETFDVCLVAFGVRNFYSLEKGLREIYRVLKRGGKLAVLELSLPNLPLLRQTYLFYFRKILPFVGKIISGHKSAYSYLPESVLKFPSITEFMKILKNVGFKEINAWSLTFGITTLYISHKD